MRNDAADVFGRRIGAWVIDALVYSAIWFGGFLVVARHGLTPPSSVRISFEINGDGRYLVGGDAALYSLFGLLLSFVSFVVIPTGTGGATLGKLALGIRARRLDGGAPSVGTLTLRWLGWIVDGFPYFLPLVGLFVALSDPERRRVGDRWAGTVVLDKAAIGAGVPPPPIPSGPPAAPGWYPDPGGSGALRWWDGRDWTGHLS